MIYSDYPTKPCSFTQTKKKTKKLLKDSNLTLFIYYIEYFFFVSFSPAAYIKSSQRF